MEESRWKLIVSRNLVACRKAAGFTQLQLAEKLNYSDKAVSKWERGESLPDISILCELAQLYGVTLDYLVTEHADKKPALFGTEKRRRRALITGMSCLLVCFIATLLFSLLYLFRAQAERQWLIFVWALPICGILCVVFGSVWGNRYHRTVAVSALVWEIAFSLYMTLSLPNRWLIFVVAVPLQLLAVLWFFLVRKR